MSECIEEQMSKEQMRDRNSQEEGKTLNSPEGLPFPGNKCPRA